MTFIEPMRPRDWTEALRQALASVPEPQRSARVEHCRQLLERGVLDPRGVWVAHQSDEIIGVQVCVPLAGSACLFWLPARSDSYTDALVQAGLNWCRSIGCRFAQALAPPEDLPLAEPLLRCGFRPISRMRQLAHNLENDALNLGPKTSLGAAAASLRYESYCPVLRALFSETLERTYEDTLDFPELNGKRTIDEILAGHQGQGKFHPEFWWLAYEGAVPVGVAMLVEVPDSTTWELAYLGIVPEHRGRRLGRAMAVHVLQALRGQPATRLLLAVDDRNVPALRLYESLDFVELECNEVLLYFF
jgi:ribosomal protein S18 acetylase RimI-like enzyme